MLTWIHRTTRLARLAGDMFGLRRQGPAGERARQTLAGHLRGLNGLPRKIGQLLALGQLNSDTPFLSLTESGPCLPAREAFAVLERSLGRKVGECFQAIEPAGIGASLGQVHRATLADGRAVAVKILYPDSPTHIETDLGALAVLALPFGGFGRGFDVGSYQREVGAMLRREVDYRQEAAALARFGNAARGFADLVVPEVVPELSTDRVLTMTWVGGQRLAEAARWPQEERRQAARVLLRVFLTSLFQWRRLHADPHPGNYRFLREQGRVGVGLLDFGCVVEPGEPLVAALAGLIDAARDGSATDGELLAGYVALGFHPDLLEPMTHLLSPLGRILFEPFVKPGPFTVADWNLAARVEQLLGEFRWNFRCAGPAALIFPIRAYLGLARFVQALDVALDWAEIYNDIRCPANLPKEPTMSNNGRNAPRAQHLRVRVEEGGSVRVNLTFKAVLAESLPDLIPPELEDQLRARHLDVEGIAAAAAAGNFAPGELFTLREGEKQVRVWLE